MTHPPKNEYIIIIRMAGFSWFNTIWMLLLLLLLLLLLSFFPTISSYSQHNCIITHTLSYFLFHVTIIFIEQYSRGNWNGNWDDGYLLSKHLSLLPYYCYHCTTKKSNIKWRPCMWRRMITMTRRRMVHRHHPPSTGSSVGSTTNNNDNGCVNNKRVWCCRW